MKELLEWFKPGARVKRYMLLQIVSIGVLVYCLVTLLSTYDLDIKMLIAYIVLLTLSSFGILFSFMLAQKNILYVSLKNISKKNKSTKVRKLLYSDPRVKKGPKIVVIGGGSGLANVLKGLKEYTANITAVVNVSEDDLSLGTAMTPKEVLTPGDIRKCVAALSTEESEINKLLMYKSPELNLKSHSVGNLIISSLIDITGSFSKAICELSNVFNLQGSIYPVSTDNLEICAGFENGEIVVGKSNIIAQSRNAKSPIKQIFLKDGNIKATAEVIEAIKTANIIVFGPGELYTSILSNLLIEDVSKAIIRSRAKKVYVSNIMNQKGETYGYTLAKYINELERYIGKHVIDYAVVNDGMITEEMMADFNQEESYPVKIDIENIQNRAISVIRDDLVLTAPGSIIHDSDKIAEIIVSITKSKKIGNLNIVKLKKKHIKRQEMLAKTAINNEKHEEVKIVKNKAVEKNDEKNVSRNRKHKENQILDIFDKVKVKAEETIKGNEETAKKPGTRTGKRNVNK